MEESLGERASLPSCRMPARRAFGIAALFIVSYILLDWLTYLYPTRPFAITLWSPAAGLALALLLVCGVRMWPAVAVAVVVADVLVRGMPGVPVLEALSAFVLVGGYVAMAATLRGPLGFRNELARPADVSLLISVSAIGTLLTAAVYVSIFRAGSMIASQDIQHDVVRFWIGHLVGIVTTAPLLLLLVNWRTMVHRVRQRPWLELAAQCCAVILVLWLIFGRKWSNEYTLFYLLFVPLIWIVAQRGMVGAAIGIAGIQLGVIAAVRLFGYQSAAVLDFQFLMLALATTGLFHGAFVSERRVTRDALDRSESRLRVIVSTAPDSIVTVDGKGVIVAANPAASRIFARPAEALIGARVYDVLPDFDRVARTGEVTEVVGIRPDGTRFAAELAVGTMGRKTPELRIAITRDVTRRKQIERELGEKQAELNRSARLAAAGEMAAALAHELHQPLSAIRNYARASQMLMQRPPASDLMEKIEHEAARAGEVVQRLRNFFRGGASQLERIGVKRLIDGALRPMLEEAARHRITIETSVADGEVELLVDRVQIETVIHSLVGNAIEAIAPTAGGERHIRVCASGLGSGGVRVSVIDSGPGINRAILERLFEPFATTKSTGTGLGLAMSRSMVEAHGGRLAAERVAGGETAFHFTLPTACLKEESNGQQ